MERIETVWVDGQPTFVRKPVARLTEAEVEEWTSTHEPNRVSYLNWLNGGPSPRKAGKDWVKVVVEQRLFHTVYERFEVDRYEYPWWEVREWDLPDGQVAFLRFEVSEQLATSERSRALLNRA